MHMIVMPYIDDHELFEVFRGGLFGQLCGIGTVSKNLCRLLCITKLWQYRSQPCRRSFCNRKRNKFRLCWADAYALPITNRIVLDQITVFANIPDRLYLFCSVLLSQLRSRYLRSCMWFSGFSISVHVFERRRYSKAFLSVTMWAFRVYFTGKATILGNDLKSNFCMSLRIH